MCRRDASKGGSMNAHRLVLVLVLAAAVGLFTLLAGVAAATGRDDVRQRTARSTSDLARVNFVNACAFSHRAPDDPIVSPGEPGRSHDHSFVGNRSTNAFSTLQTLLTASSTCDRSGHTAAYWMPTLLVSGTPVAPVGATIYYRRKTLRPVRAFPPGFRMIAGDATAGDAQPKRVTFWNCGVQGGVKPSSTVPDCPPGRKTMLRLHVTFPACWDGRSLDSPNHASHVAYQRRGVCPRSHRVEVPQISLIYRFPDLPTGAAVALASGGSYTAHADFVNSWHQPTLQRLVATCLNPLRHCGRGL
jgi:hypothetical protein